MTIVETAAAAAPLTEAAAALARRLRHTVVAAALTPMSDDAEVRLDTLPAYVEHLAGAGVGGFAVWAHTGRGPYLTPRQQVDVLAGVRAASDLPVLAGVSAQRSTSDSWPAVRKAYLDTARRAADGGADGLLVLPPPVLKDHPESERLLVELHTEIADAHGLPLVLFILHAEAGGFPYPLDVLRRLLALPSTVGVKLATLDSAMSCQDVTWLVREEFPDRLAVTGEDRMFGPSLMWGAECALVGIASALPELSVDLMRSWFSGDRTRFVEASERVDQLARVTFRAPMEGYVQRMHRVAAATGALPRGATTDPFGPRLTASDRDELDLYLARRLDV